MVFHDKVKNGLRTHRFVINVFEDEEVDNVGSDGDYDKCSNPN